MSSALLESVLSELPSFPLRAAARVEELGASAIAEEARSFGLLALLAHYLPAQFPLAKGEEMSLRFNSARLLRGTRETLARLADAGIPAVALKGVPLAARFYPEPWLRPSSDVDILVRPQDLERGTALMRSLGYHEVQGPPESVFDFYHHCTFVGPMQLMVELHFTPACGFQSEFDVDALLERAEKVRIGDAEIPVLALSKAAGIRRARPTESAL